MNKLILVIIALILFATQAFKIRTEAQLADGESTGQPDLYDEAEKAFNEWKKQYFGVRR